MALCSVCDKRVLTHSYHLKCHNCLNLIHLKCLPMVDKNDDIYINRHFDSWFCRDCVNEILPFNAIDEDTLFMETIYDLNWASESIPFDVLYCNDKVFSPFELHENFDLPLIESDPDVQYYNNQCRNLMKSCEYYLEDSFNKKIDEAKIPSGCISIMHANIRSIPRDIKKFESYLTNLH